MNLLTLMNSFYLSVLADGTAFAEITGTIWFIAISFLPLALALIVLHYLGLLVPFLKRVVPFI